MNLQVLGLVWRKLTSKLAANHRRLIRSIPTVPKPITKSGRVDALVGFALEEVFLAQNMCTQLRVLIKCILAMCSTIAEVPEWPVALTASKLFFAKMPNNIIKSLVGGNLKKKRSHEYFKSKPSLTKLAGRKTQSGHFACNWEPYIGLEYVL